MSQLHNLKAIDTIAAIATPPGRGGIGVVRVSGPHAPQIAIALLGHLPKSRYAEYLCFLEDDGTTIDKGLVLYFPAPHSFTGEDVLELQGHGGNIVLDCVLKRVLKLGARLARPGEFSERAFLNNKLDLIQAEAISDLIDSESEQSARAAIRSLQGEFSKRINEMVDTLTNLRTYLEASIDFSDETIDFLNDSEVHKKLNIILCQIKKIKQEAKQGVLLQEGMQFAIVGPPNAGKSSILNKLTGKDSAIVTSIPGTTRDLIREKIVIDGFPIQFVDTAGLRETDDAIECEGIKRSLAEMEKVDRVLYVVDGTLMPVNNIKSLYQINFLKNLAINKRLAVIRNKIDLSNEKASLLQKDGLDVISLSVKTGEGWCLLKEYLKKGENYHGALAGNFSARRRHLQALDNAEKAIADGLKKLKTYQFPELMAEDLAIAQNQLNEITGKFTAEDLLGKIFSNFCIGK